MRLDGCGTDQGSLLCTSKIHCRGSEVEGTRWIEPHIGENYTDELVCLMKGLEWHEKMISIPF